VVQGGKGGKEGGDGVKERVGRGRGSLVEERGGRSNKRKEEGGE